MSRKDKYQAAVAAAVVVPEVETQAEMTEVEVQPETVPEVVAEVPKGKYFIRAVYGTMIHPYVPMDIRTDSLTEVAELDSWLQSQISAGKIAVV